NRERATEARGEFAMSIHLHRTREWTAWTLAVFGLSPFALCFASVVESRGVRLSPVAGRVTIGGRAASDLTICLDSGGVHTAYAQVDQDGRFRLRNMRWFDGGAEPGRYHAHLYTHAGGAPIPQQYLHPESSGIVIDIDSDWNELSINLP